MERIVFLTVFHRLFDPGSDRSSVLVWKRGYEIPGAEEVELHQVYRAMAWLGESLGKDQQAGATPFSLRCVKDEFEAVLFARRRNLFSHLDLVFFDTTSIYFEGEGGDVVVPVDGHGQRIADEHTPQRAPPTVLTVGFSHDTNLAAVDWGDRKNGADPS